MRSGPRPRRRSAASTRRSRPPTGTGVEYAHGPPGHGAAREIIVKKVADYSEHKCRPFQASRKIRATFRKLPWSGAPEAATFGKLRGSWRGWASGEAPETFGVAARRADRQVGRAALGGDEYVVAGRE